MFDLTRNPFNLLQTSVRASRASISDAFEDALLEGDFSEVDLLEAQQSLTTPLRRIDAEVSWIVGASPSQADAVLALLQEGAWDAASSYLQTFGGLDKANLAADLCCRRKGLFSYVDALLEAYGEFDVGSVESLLTSLHVVAGFPQPAREQVEQSLDRLTALHAKAAIDSVLASPDSGRAMCSLVEMFLAGDKKPSRLMSEVIREYDARTEPALGRLQEQMETLTQQAQDGTISASVGDRLEALLHDWDEVSQPVQLFEEWRGYEEPRSREIYEILRAHCLWLANDNRAFDEALQIARALLTTFPELPSVADQLRKDVGDLETLVTEAELLGFLEPLLEARKSAESNLDRFVENVSTNGFSERSLGSARELYRAFAETAETAAGGEFSDHPWAILRQLTIDINNEKQAPGTALAILDALLAFDRALPSAEMVEMLRADRRTLERNALWNELNLIGTSNISRSSDILDELLDGADPDERAMLQELNAKVKHHKAAQTRRQFGWGLIGAFVAMGFIGSAISSLTESPATRSSPSRPATGRRQSAIGPEVKPTPGSGRLLGGGEIRYCVFEEKRLELLRSKIENNNVLLASQRVVERFSAAADDYNSRCANYRYREADMRAAKAAAATTSANLSIALEVDRRIASWR